MSEVRSSPPRRRRVLGANAAQTPYEQIRDAILDGELEPGHQLVEVDLAERCGVSRTPIREALSRLEQDGLVQRLDRGLFVRVSSPQEILDTYDTRLVLEARAAAVAAERRSEFDLVALRRAAEAFRASAPDPEAMARANREFHRVIWQTTHNESLRELLERLDLHLGRYPQTTLGYPGRHEEAHAEHLELLAAIEARDADRASQIATMHFTHARDIRLSLWAQQP